MTTPEFLSITSIAVSFTALVLTLIVSLFRNRWMAKQMRLSSAISIINWLEEVRPQRQLLYKTREQAKALAQWSDEEKDAANKVTRRLDILGMLESVEYLDKRLVDRFYAIPASDLWDICKDWVEDERSRRGPQHLWEFQQLAARVRYVKGNHPAIGKSEDWPRNPRSK